tara:strand:- start:3973 stop:4221 length:249 start_codon:yes stop_codon:yes gene_type:complete
VSQNIVTLFFYLYKKNNVMKLKVLMPLINKGKNYEVGDEINVADDKAQVFIDKGWASKEAKPKRETKELKKKSVETKDDATS